MAHFTWGAKDQTEEEKEGDGSGGGDVGGGGADMETDWNTAAVEDEDGEYWGDLLAERAGLEREVAGLQMGRGKRERQALNYREVNMPLYVEQARCREMPRDAARCLRNASEMHPEIYKTSFQVYVFTN